MRVKDKVIVVTGGANGIGEALCRRFVAEEAFLILPHPEVKTYWSRKSSDYDRWIKGMIRFRDKILPYLSERTV